MLFCVWTLTCTARAHRHRREWEQKSTITRLSSASWGQLGTGQPTRGSDSGSVIVSVLGVECAATFALTLDLLALLWTVLERRDAVIQDLVSRGY